MAGVANGGDEVRAPGDAARDAASSSGNPCDPPAIRVPGQRIRRRLLLGGWFIVVLTAATLRWPGVDAGAPYLTYVDEGWVLQRVVQMLQRGQPWPTWYMYPSFPLQAVAAPARLYLGARHGDAWRSEVSPWPPRRFDLVEPPELVRTARLVVLLVGLALVVATGKLGSLYCGPVAGLLAGALAAIVPALVVRGAVVTVDPFAALFSVLAMVFAERAVRFNSGVGWAAISGAAVALAVCSKYPAGLVAIAVAGVLVQGRASVRSVQRLAVAGMGGAVALAACMPGFFLHPARIVQAMLRQRQAYAQQTIGSYLQQAVIRAEWDHPLESPEIGAVFLFASMAGWWLAVRDAGRLRVAAVSLILYAVGMAALFGTQSFRPFRNLLPLVPFGCVFTAILLVHVWRRSGRGYWPLALGAALVFSTLLPGSIVWSRERSEFRDSRAEAVRWLANRSASADLTVVAAELSLPRRELARLPGRKLVMPMERICDRLRVIDRVDWVVVPALDGGDQECAIGDLVAAHTRGGYARAAAFGAGPLELQRKWRQNRFRVEVLQGN